MVWKNYSHILLIIGISNAALAMNHPQRIVRDFENYLGTSVHLLLQKESNKSLQDYIRTQQITPDTIKRTIHHELALLVDKKNQKAVALFEIPDQPMDYALTQEDMAQARDLFDVYSIENRGLCKIIRFNYKDPRLLPSTRAQALWLLYGPYLQRQLMREQMSLVAFQEYRSSLQNSLNTLQSDAVICKPSSLSHFTSDQQRSDASHLKDALLKTISREGFLGSTIVKTDKGYCKIEDLKIGDAVACCDTKDSKETISTVTFVDKASLSKHIQIAINDETILVAHEHKFYVPSSDSWVTAQELKNSPDLRQLIDPRIQDVQEVDQPLDVVRITVDSKHNFYITDQNILVHNYIPVVFEVGIAWGGAQGIAITWALLGPTITTTAAGLIYWLNKSKYKDRVIQVFKKSPAGGNMPQLPQDPNNKKQDPAKHPHGTYLDAPYHHKNSRGMKSPAPKDGQRALDNSVTVKESSPNRVGISNNEIVILKRTSEEIYHGYRTTWEELMQKGNATQAIRNALMESGMVNSSGKILK